MGTRASTEIDVHDVMSDGELAIYPYVEERGLLFLGFRKGKLLISAGPFVGLIPLTDRIAIDVQPRFPMPNLARVIDVSGGTLTHLVDVRRSYSLADEQNYSVIEFMAQNLISSFKFIEVQGFVKKFLPRREVTSFPHGRIDLNGTLRQWANGKLHVVSSQSFEQSADVPENRVIKSAFLCILSTIKSSSDAGKKLVRSANDCILKIPSYVKQASSADIADVKHSMALRRMSEIRGYYTQCLTTAVMILQGAGLSLRHSQGPVGLDSFYINIENLFETYLREILRRQANEHTSVLDGNEEGKKALFDSGVSNDAKPDILIRGQEKILVAEVKYKDKPSRDDYEQAITYAVSFRCKRVILVYPRSNSFPSGLAHIGTMDQIRLDSYAFDLSAADLAGEETRFADCLLAEFSQ